jgi:hypothetical protein
LCVKVHGFNVVCKVIAYAIGEITLYYLERRLSGSYVDIESDFLRAVCAFGRTGWLDQLLPERVADLPGTLKGRLAAFEQSWFFALCLGYGTSSLPKGPCHDGLRYTQLIVQWFG